MGLCILLCWIRCRCEVVMLCFVVVGFVEFED